MHEPRTPNGDAPGLDGLSEEGRVTMEHVTRALRAARELLGMQIAWIAEFRDDKQVFQMVDGADSFGFVEGTGTPLDDTYCVRLARGEIPEAIPDTAAVPAVAELEGTKRARIGAYVGVPIELSDGTVFGTLCCASHTTTGPVSQHELNFLRRISRRIAGQIDELREEWARTPAPADAR